MGLFNPQLQQQGGSNVTAKQAATQPDIVGAVAKGVSDVASIFGKVKAAEAEGVASSKVGGFTQELAKIASAQGQGLISASVAATKGRALYSTHVTNDPQQVAEYTKAYKGVSDTTDAFDVKETEQERQTKLVNTQMVNTGFLTGEETEDEHAAALDEFIKWKDSTRKLNSLKSNQEYNNAKTAEERRIATTNRTRTSDEATQGYVDGRGGAFNKQIKALFGGITNGVEDPTDGLIQMQEVLANFTLEVNNSGTESKDLANTLLKPYQDLVETYQNMIKNPAAATYYEAKSKALIAKQKVLVTSDPKAAGIIAVSNLFGNPTAGLLAINTESGKLFSRALDKETTGNGKTPMVVGEEAGDEYLDVIKKSTGVLRAKGSPEDQTPAVTELGGHVNQILKSVDIYATAVERPEEYNKLADFIASPEYSSMVKEGIIDPEASSAALQVLQREYVDVLTPLLKKKIHTTFTASEELLFGSDGADKTFGVLDAVDVNVTAGGIVFLPKAELDIDARGRVSLRNMVKDLNATVSKQMNRLIKMDAHLNGTTDYKAIAEQSLSTLLGQEVAEEPVKK